MMKNKIITGFLIVIMIILPILPIEDCIAFRGHQLSLAYTVIIYVVIIITLILLLCTKSINFKSKRKPNAIEWIMLGYVSLATIATFVSPYGRYAFTGEGCRYEGLFMIICYIIIFYLAWRHWNFSSKLLKGAIAASCVVAIYSIVENALAGFTTISDSTMGNGNFLSSYVTMFLPIAMVFYLKSGKKIYLLASALLFASLLCAMTTGGYITFAVYAIIIAIYAIATKVNIKRIAATIIAIILVFSVYNGLSNSTYTREVTKIKKEVNYVQNDFNKFGTMRGYIYIVSLDILFKNPIWGVGPDCLTFEMVRHYYHTDEYKQQMKDILIDKAHCEMLQIAVNTGIPSLLCYIALVGTIGIKILIRFFKDKNNALIFAIGLSILAYLIQAMGNISVIFVAPTFWAMLGIGLKLAEMDKDELEKHNKEIIDGKSDRRKKFSFRITKKSEGHK